MMKPGDIGRSYDAITHQWETPERPLNGEQDRVNVKLADVPQELSRVAVQQALVGVHPAVDPLLDRRHVVGDDLAVGPELGAHQDPVLPGVAVAVQRVLRVQVENYRFADGKRERRLSDDDLQPHAVEGRRPAVAGRVDRRLTGCLGQLRYRVYQCVYLG